MSGECNYCGGFHTEDGCDAPRHLVYDNGHSRGYSQGHNAQNERLEQIKSEITTLREAVRLGVQRLGDIVELAANGKQRGRYCSAECLGSCDECKAVQAARDYIAAAAVREAKEQA